MKRDEFISILTGWNGAVRGDAMHRQIVDAYNSFLPHPRGYRLSYTDEYCAATVSAAAILCGLTDVIPIECSCAEQIKAYRERGQWIEDDAHVPAIGEQVFYHWNDKKDYALTDCTGAANHTGIVTACDGECFTVFEGNQGRTHACAYRIVPVNGRYIRGFGTPEYPVGRYVLTRGDKGEAVRKLQELLRSCGYELDADGSFGPATQKAWGEYVAAWIEAVTGE